MKIVWNNKNKSAHRLWWAIISMNIDTKDKELSLLKDLLSELNREDGKPRTIEISYKERDDG